MIFKEYFEERHPIVMGAFEQSQMLSKIGGKVRLIFSMARSKKVHILSTIFFWLSQGWLPIDLRALLKRISA